MSPAAPINLTCTVVHAPGSVPERLWTLMRREAGGTHLHELRLVLEDTITPSGAEIDAALRAWVHAIYVSAPRDTFLTGTVEPSWVAVLDHRPLKDHATESASIHPGMVVVLQPRARPTKRARPAPAPLRLCISAGPDSGWMVRVPRGVHVLGRGTAQRGTADIRINDPRLEREHASIDVSATQVKLVREGAAPQLLTLGVPVTVGGSRVELVQDAPTPMPPPIWPLPPVTIAEAAPSGRHRTMLLMSLAPLIVGIVLVLITGMWIFLLFSVASALVAVITFVVARRQRRRFRRAVRAASAAWARQRRHRLPPPGRSVRELRARIQLRSSPAHVGPGEIVVSVGEARADAELDCLGETTAPDDLPELCVATATALTLRGSEYTGLTGPPREQLSVLRWILAQLTHHCGPDQVVLLASGPEDCGAARLGELLELDELRDHLSLNAVQLDRVPPAHQVNGARLSSVSVPVLISPVPLDPAHLRATLAEGWHVIAPSGYVAPLAWSGRPPHEQTPPAAADGWQVNLESREIHRIEAGVISRVATELVPDGLSRQTLHDHLRLGLTRISVSATDSRVPTQYTAALPVPLMARSAQLQLETLLGRGCVTDERLDLVEDGPHILLAGTTGAGKSELLKSMLLGWAARYAPSEVNFLLFDFKGGSSFQHLQQLEHALGLITDLTQAQADRALEGLRSELTRRERLFLESGTPDYAEFRRAHPDRPLARILVVFDEFRIFTQELPTAMSELMRLATLGRSLGLHLILATQRPQGAVTADIRANIGTTLCLRLRSEDEARELVGTTEPANIPRRLPGRGIIQRPGESPVTFQAVQLLDGSAKLCARPERTPTPASTRSRESTPHLVETLNTHMRRWRIHRTHTPLCPPLPEILRAPIPARDIMFGLVDEPAQQTQRSLNLDLDEGVSVALLGESGSGGTEALGSLVHQLLVRPEEVHVYLLDGDHSLERFRRHPRVGSWLSTEHPQEAQHLVSELHRLVVRRRTVPSQEHPPVVLLISGHSRWQGLSHLVGLGSLEHDLGVLISEGAGYGVSAVVAGGRELALGKLGSRLQSRIYLPYGVSEEVRLLWPKLRVTDGLPGRGVLATADAPPPGLTIQLVTGVVEQRIGSRWTGETDPADEAMIRVHPLPEAPPLPTLEGSSPVLSLGLRQFTHSPARLQDGSWQIGLILGAARTGKTNALRVIAAQRRCLTLADHGPSGKHSDSEAAGPALLLVDDADRCTPEQHRSIERWLDAGGIVFATARPSPNIFSQLPWSYRARGGAANFVLSPLTRSQGDAFGSSIPVVARLIPGRAAWLGPDGPVLIQWWQHPASTMRRR